MIARRSAFSLVEVVLALGIVSFAIVAILGLIPTGLQTSHSSQDETRAAQIAQSILSTMASQAQTQFNSISFQEYDPNGSPLGPISFDLSSLNGTSTGWAANNEGEVFAATSPARFLAYPFGPPSRPADTAPTYAIQISFNSSPTGFDATYANEVTVSVFWPANASAANQTRRDFARIISKY